MAGQFVSQYFFQPLVANVLLRGEWRQRGTFHCGDFVGMYTPEFSVCACKKITENYSNVRDVFSLTIYLNAFLSIYLTIYLSIYLSVYLFFTYLLVQLILTFILSSVLRPNSDQLLEALLMLELYSTSTTLVVTPIILNDLIKSKLSPWVQGLSLCGIKALGVIKLGKKYKGSPAVEGVSGNS